jgi:glycosyltransferase involved in cell wall biosynthesis
VALSGVDLVTAVSADLLGALESVYPSLRGKSKVLRNGNPMVFGRRATGGRRAAVPSEGYVLAVGSLIHRKAYDVLLNAMRMVRERGYDLRLVIVGDGPEAARLSELASKLGIAAAVAFVGEVPHDEIGPFYHGAKFFVHTAREEGFGMVIVEAMSCRKAVVATRVGGIPEFVRDGETGILVLPDDPASLADGITRLEKDEELRSAMGERGYELVAGQYGWERMVDEYLGAYELVLGRT